MPSLDRFIWSFHFAEQLSTVTVEPINVQIAIAQMGQMASHRCSYTIHQGLNGTSRHINAYASKRAEVRDSGIDTEAQ